MRWAWVVIKSFAVGVSVVIVSLVVLFVGLHFYTGYVLGFGPNVQVGWDIVSLLGPHWELILITTPLVVFSLGFWLSFWRFGKRLQV